MTQSEALESLIAFAPTWYHSIGFRLAYVDGEITEIYNVFTSPDFHYHKVELFQGTNLEELVASAKNFIYISRIEQTLTEPVDLTATICP